MGNGRCLFKINQDDTFIPPGSFLEVSAPEKGRGSRRRLLASSVPSHTWHGILQLPVQSPARKPHPDCETWAEAQSFREGGADWWVLEKHQRAAWLGGVQPSTTRSSVKAFTCMRMLAHYTHTHTKEDRSKDSGQGYGLFSLPSSREGRGMKLKGVSQKWNTSSRMEQSQDGWGQLQAAATITSSSTAPSH